MNEGFNIQTAASAQPVDPAFVARQTDLKPGEMEELKALIDKLGPQ